MSNKIISENISLTMVIPTYNEAENLKRLIPVLISLPLPRLKILIVDDNSPDGTGVIADEFSKEHTNQIEVLHRSSKEGLGPAYIAGIAKALTSGCYAIGQMDADFSHPPEKIVEMHSLIARYDVVIGSRYIPGGSLDANWPVTRKFLSAFGNYYARTILSIPVQDVTGGYRLFRKDVLQRLPLERIQSTGYVFMVELLYCAFLLGARIKEVPIYFKERSYGRSKMSLKIQIEAAFRMWQIRFRHRNLLLNNEN
jgi:dolichol-phosphate mannosyltransferase